MDRKHLHLAYSPLARSAKKWASAHGPRDEARHDSSEVVIWGRAEDVSAKHLGTAAEQLTLRRDVIYVVDAIAKIEGSPIGGQSSEAANADPK